MPTTPIHSLILTRGGGAYVGDVTVDLSQFRSRPKREGEEEKLEGEEDVRLLSDARIEHIAPKSGYKRIKDKVSDRRRRHDTAAKQYDVTLKEISDALEDKVMKASYDIQNVLEDADLQMDAVFKQLNDDAYLVKQDYEFVTSSWARVEQMCDSRTDSINAFGHNLDQIENQRAQLVGKKLQLLVSEMISAAYKLPNDIERLIETEAHEVNLVLIANQRGHADLISRLLKQDVQVKIDARGKWRAREDAWRSLRHEQALEQFRCD